MPANGMAQTAGAANGLSAGAKAVIMNPFSGPTGAPLGGRTLTFSATGQPQYVDDPTNISTGALSTGIGFGPTHIFGPTAPASIQAGGFTDDYIPGVSLPSGASITNTAPTAPAQTPYGAVLTAIGGCHSGPAANGIAPTLPYGFQPLLNFGNGGSRDAGAASPFTGFSEKTVTATGTVAVGAAIEAGFINRSDRTMVTGESAFGSSTAASPAVAVIP